MTRDRDELGKIGFYTLKDFRAKQASKESPLWRCELILTDKCNFNCFYCRGLVKENKGDISFSHAKKVVEMWANGGLKNIRFSGGEPTLWSGLYLLVALARKEGIRRVAISTNGSAPLDNYKRLVGLGVNDISISLDACCSATAKKMSGIDIWKTLTKNINELCKLTYVTVGVVLTHKNIKETERIVNFASKNLGVSDIRLISAAQESDLEKLKSLSFHTNILDKHPILTYRCINFIMGRDVRGITSTDTHYCPLVLDDMVVVKNKHYPCIIYMRERGEPIGTITDFNIERIRTQRYNWFKNHDTHKDPICQKNCLDVCIDYNNRWHEFN